MKTNKDKNRTNEKSTQAPSAMPGSRAKPMSAGELLKDLDRHRKPPATSADPSAQALVEKILVQGATTPVGAAGNAPRAHRVIKLGLDVHLDRYVVLRQLDGGTPQPPQWFRPSEFLVWAKKQTQLKAGRP